MNYNTQQEKLIISEYGRNIQKLIMHAKTIEKKEERQAFVERIVELMQQISPSNRNLDEKKSKLWNHIYKISNYELDVDYPVEVAKNLEAFSKPRPIHYPRYNRRNRHYGSKINELIEKAIAFEDVAKKEALTSIIASYMKTAYKNWNREVVSDEIIKNDLKKLSRGLLTLDESISIESPSSNNNRRRRNHGSNNNRRNNNRNRNNNNNNYKRRKR